MNIFQNLDLLAVIIAIAGTVVLGFTVYFSNKNSITGITFLLFSLISGLWGLSTYFGHKVEPALGLWLLRIAMFLAVWQAFTLLQLFIIFPQVRYSFSKAYKFFILPITMLTSILALTPLILNKIINISADGEILQISNGPAISLFGIIGIGFVTVGICSLSKKIRASGHAEKKPFIIILAGAILMFALIITFNFVFPAILNNSDYIGLAGLSILPFVIFTAYAILKHKLFNIKVIGTASMVFLLSVVTFTEIIVSEDISIILFRSCVFLLVLVFGTFLIKSVFGEVEQREHIEKLAKNLEIANDKLKELDQLKSEFLSLATHQIRAPLTAIKGYASMLTDGDFGVLPQKAKDSLEIITRSCQNLINTVGDFLNISRIEQGRMVYEKTVFDIAELTREITNELKPNIDKSGLSLELDIPKNVPIKVKADRDKIKQVIENVIDNAIKYTVRGSIKISAFKDPDKAKIAVKDSGVGIDPSEISKLFGKFSRTKNAGKTNVVGTGLGLYIGKKMTEAQGGDIKVYSEGIGLGSTFTIELPAYSQ